MKRTSKCRDKNSSPEFLNFVRESQSFLKIETAVEEKNKKSLGLGFFSNGIFYVLCLHGKSILIFKKIPEAKPVGKKLCGLGQANRGAMRHCRSRWQGMNLCAGKSGYLLHLAWTPLHARSPPFEQGDTSRDDSTRRRGSLPDLLISICLEHPKLPWQR